MVSACACMGVRPGDEYCYCQLKARGMSTAHLEWTEADKLRLDEALQNIFGPNAPPDSNAKNG